MQTGYNTSQFRSDDAFLVLSVSGHGVVKGVSVNLVRRIKLAGDEVATILGIVGRDGGYTKAVRDA